MIIFEALKTKIHLPMKLIKPIADIILKSNYSKLFFVVLIGNILANTPISYAQDFWDSIPYPDTAYRIYSIETLGRDTLLIGASLATREELGGCK